MLSVPDKAKPYGWFVLKLLILIIAGWLVYRTLSPISAKSWSELTQNFAHTGLWTLILLSVLSLTNWTLEIIKWQTAIKPIVAINLTRATHETLLAYSIGFITPLKLGEYAVKTKLYPQIQKNKVIISHFYCHFSQLICTIIFGLIGLINFDSSSSFFHFDLAWLVFIAGSSLFGLLLYGRYKKQLKSEDQLPVETLMTVVFLSALRFVVFSSMMALGLYIMGSPLIWTQAIFGIWTMYLIQLMAPTFSMLDVVVKSGGAVVVFQEIIPAQIIMGAVLLQYILSQVLPLIIGLTLKPPNGQNL